MSFQQGLSGLDAASKNLDVIGNNVANASTVGFKGSDAQFADVMAASLTGAAGMQIGIGTKVATVAQQFTEGTITTTNNPLDIAVNGGGFFRMSDNGAISYSRNGQFQLDANGYVVNAQGLRLTGYSATNGVINTGAPTDLQISTADLTPVATQKVTAVLNLDSRDTIPTTTTFSATDPTSYNNSTSVSVYDTLGNAHALQTFYVKTGAGTWNVFATLDGAALNGGNAEGSVTFKTDGTIDLTQTSLPIPISAPVTTGATTPLVFNLDLTGTTQYGSNFGVNAMTQNGNTSGKLSGFSVGPDGTILGRYSNGQSSKLGQVVLTNFANPQGLIPMGNNVWTQSPTSGVPLDGVPGTSTLGVLQSDAVEGSNVDLTSQLVDMITAQRDYQANAQTIKTQDQVMNTLVNLR